MLFKLGRLGRAYSPRVPHLSAVLAGATRLQPPVSVDYTKGLPSDLGFMLNDSLGDCTCAAYYHAKQVWSFNAAGAIDTQPDSNVRALYEQACGYNPADSSTDQGGVEQDVLTYLLNTGAPIGADGSGRDKIAAFVEVDPRNFTDIRSTIYTCGVAYIGFNVPAYLMADGPAPIWDVSNAGDQSIVGGHAVILAGYDMNGFIVVSWGRVYRMTAMFFSKYVDEVYGIVNREWFKSTGLAPWGGDIDATEAQMEALKAAA